MTTKYSFLPIVALLLLLGSCSGYEAAQKAYNMGEYGRAAELFNDAQKDEENKARKAEENFLLGECYRHLGMPSRAVNAYQRAIRGKYDDDEALLRLAEAYRAVGKFDEADDAYAAYKERHKTDRRVIAGEESSVMARDVWTELSKKVDPDAETDSGYVIKPFKEINSRSSDFCPAFVGEGFDVVYFSSMRPRERRTKGSKITGQAYSTLYMSKVDGKGKWTEPQPIGEPFGEAHVDDGAAFVTADGHSMFFTRCVLNDQEGSPVHVYEMKREGGRWSDPARVIPGGDSTLMVAHPALSVDGQTLIFVSDKEEGSIGGLDLWFSQRNVDDTWGPAQNMGAMVNTAGDEMFPYVRQDGTLYFSSNGHKGFGGLDIYKAITREDGRYIVTNMGIPINSPGDDFGIAFMGTAEEGLLTSNRGNTKGVDNIYSFCLPPVILTIEGRVGKSGKKAFSNMPNTQTQNETASLKAKEKENNETIKTNKKNDKKTTASAKGNSKGSVGKVTTSQMKKQTTSSTANRKEKKSASAFVPLPDAFVRIVGSDGTNIKLKANEEGVVSFVAERDVRYVILSGAPGYANERVELSTEGLNKTQTLSFTSLLNTIN